MIAKCFCNNCGVHIEFEADGFQPGTRAECPHCHMETILFIPPSAVPSKQSVRKSKNSKTIAAAVVAIIVIICFAAAFLFQKSSKQTKQTTTNLKPVIGAFGWKLGDRLPEQLRSQVRDGNFQFKPEAEMPPLSEFKLELLEDGRIYGIEAIGYAPDTGADSYTCERSIVSVLTEKYGLQSHDRGGDFNTYRFGNNDQMASLQIYKYDLFTLSYSDQKLLRVYLDDLEAKRKKDEDEKKAALSKGL